MHNRPFERGTSARAVEDKLRNRSRKFAGATATFNLLARVVNDAGERLDAHAGKCARCEKLHAKGQSSRLTAVSLAISLLSFLVQSVENKVYFSGIFLRRRFTNFTVVVEIA